MSKQPGDLREELAGLDDKYAATKVDSPTAPVPDGRYNAEIEQVILTRATGGAPMLEYTLVIISDGPHKGRKVWYHRTITERSLKWVKLELSVCGLRLERISEVADHLPALAKVRLDITIRTKGEHRNVYFNRRLDATAADANVFEGGDEGGDDFPI